MFFVKVLYPSQQSKSLNNIIYPTLIYPDVDLFVTNTLNDRETALPNTDLSAVMC